MHRCGVCETVVDLEQDGTCPKCTAVITVPVIPIDRATKTEDRIPNQPQPKPYERKETSEIDKPEKIEHGLGQIPPEKERSLKQIIEDAVAEILRRRS
jgi:hypothetical protein